MTVIALSMETGTMSEGIATGLAGALGLTLVDQRRLEREIAECSDGTSGIIRHYVSGWSRLSKRSTISCRQLSRRIREEILETATEGNVLILGWSGAEVLHPVPDVVRVLLRAPVRSRERNIMRQCAYGDVRTARLEIDSTDALMARYLRRMFGADGLDPDRYDLVLDVERIAADHCVELIGQLVRQTSAKRGGPQALAEQLRSLQFAELVSADRVPDGNAANIATVTWDPTPIGMDVHGDVIAIAERQLYGRPGQAPLDAAPPRPVNVLKLGRVTCAAIVPCGPTAG